MAHVGDYISRFDFVTETAINRINHELQSFGAYVESHIMKLGVSNIGKNLVKYARRYAPKETGALREKIGFETKFNTVTGVVVARLGVFKGKVGTRRPSRYYHIVHGGANPHKEMVDDPARDNPLITSRAGFLTGSDDFAESVNHPGSKGHKFLTKAVSRHGAFLYIRMVAIIRLAASIRLRGFRRFRQRISPSADNIGNVIEGSVTKPLVRKWLKIERFSFTRMKYVTMMRRIPFRTAELQGRHTFVMTNQGQKEIIEWSANGFENPFIP